VLCIVTSLACLQAAHAQQDGPPSTPEGVRATAYSSTAGGIAWQRSSDDRGAVVGYEVRRDDEVLGVFDALSYVDKSLAPGTDYRYAVTAIDNASQRSGTTSVTLTSNSVRAGGFGETTDAPTGLRSDVYSRTAGEIFWTRPAAFGLVYDVYRNGELITRTDGVSYFDDTLSGGRTYTYEVVAIDRQGRRSLRSGVTLNTPGERSEPSETSIWDATTSIADLALPAGLYQRDGYAPPTMERFDVETVPASGPCNVDEQSGCTLADVLADNDPGDALRVEIPVHFVADDLPEDGQESNAELRQRGSSSRRSDRKSFRIEFKGKGVRWRDEDILQLKKTPFDPTQIKEKLAFTLMQEVPNLPSSNTQFVNLWIDDGDGPENYGAFTHTEAGKDEFFEQRGWDEDGKLYKAERFVFSASEDLPRMVLDEEGEPLDKDEFETRVEIEVKGDKDHRPLIHMVEALNDRERDFGDVLDTHFDRDNLVTWFAVNLLLRQLDAVTHNFYLYNPVDSERFYLLPWDYDQTFGVETPPEDALTSEALSTRLFYGLGKYRASNLFSKLMKEPGFYDALLDKARALRNGPFSDARVTDLATTFASLVGPVASSGPDRYNYKPIPAEAFSRDIGLSLEALEGGYLPLPPRLERPRVDGDTVRLAWSAAFDVSGRRSLSYDIEFATSADFADGDTVYRETGIEDSRSRVVMEFPTARLGAGTYFVRLLVRADGATSDVWQVASNREQFDGETRIGVRRLVVP